jgi:hypothetical protein
VGRKKGRRLGFVAKDCDRSQRDKTDKKTDLLERLGQNPDGWKSNKLFDFCFLNRQRAANPIKFALDLLKQRG